MSVDTVVAVIGEHFPVPTTTAEHEARGAIGLFRTFFGRVKNLTPSIFLTREDED